VVNSQFTASAYKETFRKWSSRSPAILYPSVRSCNIFKDNILDSLGVLSCSKTFFLSINRFERKKRLHIAILAFHILRKRLDARSGEKPFLILGGGYDERIRENVEHIIELKRLVKKISVGNHVLFLPSLSEKTKECLLQNSIALLYTPINEHFGITPLESMAAGRPVISCNSGGPCETVIDCGSGLLVSGTPEDFAEAMFSLYMETERADRLGEYAKRHIQNVFSAYQFGKKIDEILL
jgi:alpha-1,3/alpha-1,6-mannosyltransferase